MRSSVELQPVVFFLDLETVNFNDRSDCNQSLSKIVDLQPVVIELQPVVLDLVLGLFIDHGNTSRLREYVAHGGTIGEERPRHCGPHPPDVHNFRAHIVMNTIHLALVDALATTQWS